MRSHVGDHAAQHCLANAVRLLLDTGAEGKEFVKEVIAWNRDLLECYVWHESLYLARLQFIRIYVDFHVRCGGTRCDVNWFSSNKLFDEDPHHSHNGVNVSINEENSFADRMLIKCEFDWQQKPIRSFKRSLLNISKYILSDIEGCN